MPNEFTGQYGEIVGAIRPGDDGEPVFRIVRREARDLNREAPGLENVRPCDHPTFVLDERWSTVTCGKCKERMDAFAVLMQWATWQERLKVKNMIARDAEKSFLVTRLREIAKRRALTDGERAELTTWLRSEVWRATLDDVKERHAKLEKALNERRRERRVSRRAARPEGREG